MSEDIKFTCPHCGQHLVAPPDKAGQSVDCPNCSKTLDIPLPIAKFADHSQRPPEPGQSNSPPVPQTSDVRPCPFCAEQILVNAVKCKHCGEFLDGRQPESRPTVSARIKRKSSFAGVGCLIQGLGLVVIPVGFFFFGFGLIVTIPLGIVLLIIGSIKASYPVCSNCGTKLTGTNISTCPACNATFE